MNVSCTGCHTVFRVDPAKVPTAGVRARCSVCQGIFWVRHAVPSAVPTPEVTAARSPAIPPPPPPPVAPTATAPPPATAPAPAREPTKPPAARTEAARPIGPAVPPPTGTGAGPTRPAVAPSRPAVPAPPAIAAAAPAIPPIERKVASPGAPPTAPAVTTASVATPPKASPSQPVIPAAPATAVKRARVNPFLSQDPGAKARRLARALISDMVVYHPAKRREGIQNGSLKQLFDEEIRKSWEEYVDQVGKDIAESTPYFNEALNEILADGRAVFP